MSVQFWQRPPDNTEQRLVDAIARASVLMDFVAAEHLTRVLAQTHPDVARVASQLIENERRKAV